MFLRLFFLILSCSLPLLAKPKGHVVKHGDCTIEDLQKHLKIHQHSDKAIIHWDQFSIEQGEIAEFFQPNAGAAVLNRVTGKNPSEIYGMLKGNGKVFLINQNGILIGPTGQIRTNGFVASALDVANAEFLEGKDLHFSGSSDAKVQNLGQIESKQGNIYLIAKRVENPGKLETSEGQAYLLGGTDVYLSSDEMTIRVRGEGSAESAGVIEATQIEIRSAGGNISQLAINLDGVLHATGTQKVNGRVLLSAESGTVEAGGEIIAQGGEVHLLGSEVTLDRPLAIDVSHSKDGGEVIIGGAPQKDLPLANSVFVGPEIKIYADSKDNGDAGTVIAYAKDKTAFHGEVFARALGDQGDGGFVEVSSKGDFKWGETAFAHRESKNGQAGLLLWDPPNITVDDAMATSINSQLLTGPVTLQADDTISFTTVLNQISWSTNYTFSCIAEQEIECFNQIPGINSTGTGSFTAIDFQVTDSTATSSCIFFGGINMQTVDGAINISAIGQSTVQPHDIIRMEAPAGPDIISNGSGAINIFAKDSGPAFGPTVIFLKSSAIGDKSVIRSNGSGEIVIRSVSETPNGSVTGIEFFNCGVTALNQANITIEAELTAATGTFNNPIFFNDGFVQSENGNTTIAGKITSNVSQSSAIRVGNTSSIQSSGTGNITIEGRGSASSESCTGVNLVGGPVVVGVNDGTLTVIGEGSNAVNGAPGVEVTGNVIVEATGNGSVFLNGLGAAAGPNASGVFVHNGATVQVNNGRLVIDGVAQANGEAGVSIQDATTVVQGTGAGEVIINGLGGPAGPDASGVFIHSGAAVQVNNGRLVIDGVAQASGEAGVSIQDATTTVQGTGTGAVIINGLGGPAGPDASGVFIHSGATVQVNNGSLFFDGVARANGESGVCIENGGTVVQSTGSGGITLNGVGIGSGPGIKTTVPIGSATTGGPITFRADTMSIGANVQGTDLLSIENLTPTQPMNIGDNTPMTGLHISNAELAFFVPGFTEIIFGSPPPGRQEITIDSGGVLAFTEPVRFRGGTINVLNPISSPGNQVIFNIGQNSGGVLNLNAAITASNVIALGSFSDDVFNINVSQAMLINGGDGLNTLNAPNFSNQWIITGNDAGQLSTGPIDFINVGSLAGGNLDDYFTFQDQTTLSGLLDGGAPAAPNTLDLTQYTSPFLIEFTSPTSGNASMIQLGFINIATELQQNILVPTGPLSKLVFFPDQLIPIFSNQISLSFRMLDPSQDDPWTLFQRYLLGVINGYDMRGMNWGVLNNARVNYRKKGVFDSNIFEINPLHDLFRGRQPRDFRMNAASAAPF